MKRIFTVGFIFILLAVSAFPQTSEEMANARQADQLAIKAYQSKDLDEFLTQMNLANAARPNHPRLIYDLARAFAGNGHSENALNSLERLAKMGLSFEIAKDDDFKAFAGSERFKAVVARFAGNKKAVNSSARAFAVDDKTLINEGLAYNAITQTFYVGSVHQPKIVAVKNVLMIIVKAFSTLTSEPSGIDVFL